MRQSFGECVLDRDRRELTRNHLVVHTTPKLLTLLELLIDAAPRAVTKDEIHRAVWPGTFVAEATLSSLVAELRDAIGDDARAPRLLRTVHGYGYAFIGAVARTAEASHGANVRSCRIIIGDREIVLAPGVHLLGRSPDVAVFVDDAGVSRQHARISVTPDGAATLEDLGSKNGTVLDGHRIDEPVVLGDGSMIVLGAIALKFRAFAAASSTETVTRHP